MSFASRIAVFFVLVLGSVAHSADQAAIDAAVRRGAEFLRRTHAPAPNYNGGNHGLGQSALAGIALLEAGIPPNDPSLQQISLFVRTRALTETRTYHLALAVVFLDRLKDPRDEGLIQVLGVRLYRGVNVAGGYTYSCWDEIPQIEAQRLALVLYPPQRPQPQPMPRPTEPAAFPTPKPAADPVTMLHPEAARQLIAIRRDILVAGRQGVGDDNSNTQFGLVGLWVATRHGLVVDDAFALIEGRFIRTQNPNDGGWAYSGTGSSTPAMTCAGLLGLAAGAAIRESRMAALTARVNPDKAKSDDPFFNPKPPTAENPNSIPGIPDVPTNAREAAIKAALTALGQVLISTRQPNGGAPNLSNFVGHGNAFYVLWSIERVAVAYGLPTIGNVDWYDWGASYLLSVQAADGAWKHNQYDDDINTAFAMLFLLKANFTSDLSGKIKDKVADPGRAELRGGGAAPALFAPPKAAPNQPDAPPPVAIAKLPEETSGPTPTLPAIVDLTPAETLTRSLVELDDEKWPAELAKVTTARGGVNTLALAWTAARVDGARQKETRAALAERLARMTPATLRNLVRDPDPEIRRAAVLACAMRDDKAHIADLIGRITDPSDPVVRAARAGLRSLTGEDFGPDPGASDAAKLRAATAWQKWADAQPK